MPRHGTGDRKLHKEIRRKCRQSKEEWFNEEHEEVERMSITDLSNMHKDQT